MLALLVLILNADGFDSLVEGTHCSFSPGHCVGVRVKRK